MAVAEAATPEAVTAAATRGHVVVALPAPARAATPGTEQRQRAWEMQYRDPTPVRARALAEAEAEDEDASSGEEDGERGEEVEEEGLSAVHAAHPPPPNSSPWGSPTHSSPPTPPGEGTSLSPSALRDAHRVSPLQWGDAASPGDQGRLRRDQTDQRPGGRTHHTHKGPRSVRFASSAGDEAPAQEGYVPPSPTPAASRAPHSALRAQVTLNGDGSVSIHLASPTDGLPAQEPAHAATPAPTPGHAAFAHPVSGTRVSVIDGTGSPAGGAQHAAAALQRTVARGGQSATEVPHHAAQPLPRALAAALDPEGDQEASAADLDAQRIRRAGRWIPSPASGVPRKWGTRQHHRAAAVTPGTSARHLLLRERASADRDHAAPATADAATEPDPSIVMPGPAAMGMVRAAPRGTPWQATPRWDDPPHGGAWQDEWLPAAWAASDSERARAHLASAADATKRRIALLRHSEDAAPGPGSARPDPPVEKGDPSSRVVVARPWSSPAPTPERPPQVEAPASANPILSGARSRINPLITPGHGSFTSPEASQQRQASPHASLGLHASMRSLHSHDRSPNRHLIVRNPRRVGAGGSGPSS